MSKVQIFQDGRVAGATPISGSDFTTKNYLSSNFYTKTGVDTLLENLPGEIWVATKSGSIEATASAAVLSQTARNIVCLTSASYSAITNPDPETLYIITDFTASVESASYAIHADTASIANNAISSSYALTASFAENVVELPLETGSAPYSLQSTTGSIASGTASFAHGNVVTASGIYSHAEGNATSASGQYSHAEGAGTVASGYYSHAEGETTEASGFGSHAEGNATSASGNYSHAEGFYTIATNQYEHAQGRYNATASSQIFSVGCGYGEAERKSAISIITGSGIVPSASVYVYGIGGYDGTTISGSVDLANVLIGIANAAAKKPVVLYETDGTTGLLGHNANTYEGHWQLEDYDFTPYKRLECFFKASATSSADVYTPAVVVTIPLDEAAKGPNIYMGSQMVALPFNRNRQYLVGCAVDSTKTKFQVVHQNTIWDITTSDANSVGRYMYKILGYFD